ncbi:DMT family transporter [Paenibacillus sp. NPDC058174]|uniref:DMT family transporter n=1 Tax=Paenibacillus sp. NPDC058174 TaxID=3346366 RepID=UPI0036DF2C49
MSKLTKLHTAMLIAFLVIVWGINWPLTKEALQDMPPILFSGVRTLIGGLLLLMVAIPRYKRLQLRKNGSIYLISTLFNVILYYGLQTIGIHYLPAGLFSAIVFLQPVLVGLFSWLWLGEMMNGLKIAGLILGFAGVGVMSAGGLSGHLSMTGIVLALSSGLSWALGTVFVKKVSSRVDSIWLVSIQLTAGGLLMTGAGSFIESWSDVNWRPQFIFNLLFISVFVIAIGWIVFYKLINSGEASRMSSFTFLIPLVAIMISTLFFNEPFTFSLLGGLVCILASIYLVNRKPAARQAMPG